MTSRILYGPRDTRRALRARRVSLRTLLIAGLTAVIIGGAIIILRLPALQITDIRVSGGETVDPRAVRAHTASRLAGQHLFLLPRSSYVLAHTVGIAAGLRAAFPAIADLRVEKAFPRTLTVSLAERRFWAILCNALREEISPQCVSLDETGFAYASAPLPQGNLILVVDTDRADLDVGTQQIAPDLMGRLRAIQEGMPAAADTMVSRFALRGRAPNEIRASTAEGFLVYFKRDDDLANALRVLKKILEAEIGDRRKDLNYIDARFGNKAFYKWK